MDSATYQQAAARTLIDRPDAAYTDQELMVVWNALGLAGEAGEVANLIKKAVFHRHGLDLAQITDELGDVLWYIAALCTTLGLNLATVQEQNLAKLARRYPDGYSSAASKKIDILVERT